MDFITEIAPYVIIVGIVIFFWRRNRRISTTNVVLATYGISPLQSYIVSGVAVFITSIPLILLWIAVLLKIDALSFLTAGLAVWISLVAAALLLAVPRAQVRGYSDVVNQIPVNHAGVLTWLGGVLDKFYLVEGWPLIPWWLGFGISTTPIAKTLVQLHDEKGNPLPLDDRGHYTDGEANGFVYMGERLIQEVVKVQADDLVEVTGDYNSSEQVVNPAVWQRASNPMGTIIGRQEATLRTGVSYIHAEDVNGVRSLFPSMMEGTIVLMLRAQKDKGAFVTGDLVRNKSGKRLVEKAKKGSSKVEISDKKDTYLALVNKDANPDCKPEGGFTLDDIQILNIAKGLYEEIERVGGKHVEKSVSIKDFTLPQPVGEAAQKVAIERREQVAEVIQAETVDLVASKHANSIKKHGMDAVEVALAERGKAAMVIGKGENPIAQALAGITNTRK